MEKKYLIIIKFLLSIFVLFLLAVIGWYFMPFANNPVQNKNIKILHTEISNLKIKNSVGGNIVFSPFSAYVGACRIHIPVISYNDCLSLLVEGESADRANQNAEIIIINLKKIKLNDSAELLKDKYVVLIPGVRDESFIGNVNPYNVSKHFKTNQPFIIKLGK
jgi:hypothetical protein